MDLEGQTRPTRVQNLVGGGVRLCRMATPRIEKVRSRPTTARTEIRSVCLLTGDIESAEVTLARIFDLIAEPNRATIAQRPHKTRLSGTPR